MSDVLIWRLAIGRCLILSQESDDFLLINQSQQSLAVYPPIAGFIDVPKTADYFVPFKATNKDGSRHLLN